MCEARAPADPATRDDRVPFVSSRIGEQRLHPSTLQHARNRASLDELFAVYLSCARNVPGVGHAAHSIIDTGVLILILFPLRQ